MFFVVQNNDDCMLNLYLDVINDHMWDNYE